MPPLINAEKKKWWLKRDAFPPPSKTEPTRPCTRRRFPPITSRQFKIDALFEKRKRNAFDASETTRGESFTSGNGGSDAPNAVSNALLVTFPNTCPHPIGSMDKADSISGVSETSSIFGSKQDGRCIILREKRQHISTLYARFAALHANHTHFSPQEIEDSEEIYENVNHVDSDVWQLLTSLLTQEGYLTRQILVTRTSCIMLLETAKGNASKWRSDPSFWRIMMRRCSQIAGCQLRGRFVLTWGALTGLIWTLTPFPVRQGRQRCASFRPILTIFSCRLVLLLTPNSRQPYAKANVNLTPSLRQPVVNIAANVDPAYASLRASAR